MTSGGFTAFQTGPGRHPGLSPQLDDLHSQFDAYPETQLWADRSRSVAKTERNRIAEELLQAPDQTVISRQSQPAHCLVCLLVFL